ncbi:uncharacterized protein N7477_007099 [Penicillium maclennaniae]|uniref:uncharacterized protein n=1 Tax=Penicillium maclennaniae TaxID=1343394 RepID=UPI002540842B|nr:uncharacterized protein N7477_007099 [Penicillium maclennaniae]KAJ5668529.1 hypothetical protein N7477_007099 [Penicillium maclennaniae]
MEKRLGGISIADVPDLCTGTSVGALMAMDITLNGSSAEESLAKFPDFARIIFEPYYQPTTPSTLARHHSHAAPQGSQPVSNELWDSLQEDLSLATLQHPTQYPYRAYPNVPTTDPTVEFHVSGD